MTRYIQISLTLCLMTCALLLSLLLISVAAKALYSPSIQQTQPEHPHLATPPFVIHSSPTASKISETPTTESSKEVSQINPSSSGSVYSKPTSPKALKDKHPDDTHQASNKTETASRSNRDNGTLDNQQPNTGQRTSRSKHLEIHSKLKTTCDKWSRWYKRDKTENARVNMNIACRDAAHYAKTQLNWNTGKPNFAAKEISKKKTKPSATLIAARKVSPPYQGKPRCHYWKTQVDKIRSKLRSGYKEPQGNSLRQKRRNYWQLLRDNC